MQDVYLQIFGSLQNKRVGGKNNAALCGLPQPTDIKELISSSLGGFRKFYANCFPFIARDESSPKDSDCNELNKPPDEREDRNTGVNPSDLVWIVDVQYKNKVIFSNVVWGIPYADDFQGWFSKSLFRIDLLDVLNVDDEQINEDGLPTIVSVDKVGRDGEFWGQLMDDVKLSWIVMNKKTGQAANLSSWSPLLGRRHLASEADFVMRFGSLLPAQNILPCKFVECILEMRCKLCDSDRTSLKIGEVSMELEDMMGARVNGRNSLLILERALNCRSTKDPGHILEFRREYLTEQSKFREANICSAGRLDTFFVISGIVAYAAFCYFIFRQSNATLVL